MRVKGIGVALLRGALTLTAVPLATEAAPGRGLLGDRRRRQHRAAAYPRRTHRLHRHPLLTSPLPPTKASVGSALTGAVRG